MEVVSEYFKGIKVDRRWQKGTEGVLPAQEALLQTPLHQGTKSQSLD